VRYAPNNQIYTLSDTKSAWDGVTPNASTPLEKRLYKIEADRRKTGLSLLFSAPIAGCDLLSSCLYTAGSCAAVSGKVINRNAWKSVDINSYFILARSSGIDLGYDNVIFLSENI